MFLMLKQFKMLSGCTRQIQMAAWIRCLHCFLRTVALLKKLVPLYCPLVFFLFFFASVHGPALTKIYFGPSSIFHQVLTSGEQMADQLVGDIQGMLSTHRGEIACFAQELRDVSFSFVS